MPTNISERFAVHMDDYKHYTTDKLREHFLVSNIFTPNTIELTYTHYERIIVGGALPIEGPLNLQTVAQLRAENFLDRRELGAINIGGEGEITVDSTAYTIGTKEAIYIGAGSKNVVFKSVDPKNPAKFYLNSAPAHHAYPTKKVGQKDADVVTLGSSENCNERTIRKLLVNSVIETCQLQMGMTELKSGSVWNTLPAHTHSRRMEAYFYFNLPDDQAVCHFMGPAEETRHLWMHNEEAVVSPPWSMHSGCGTANYTFIWGMAGENLDYGDMDFHQANEIK